MKHVLLYLLFMLCANAQNFISSSEDLISEMQKTYHKTWFKHLTFTQKTTFYRDGKISGEQTWLEAMSLPGRLHIKFGSKSGKSGMLFSDGFEYRYRDGKISSSEQKYNPLLFLGFDVYGQAPKKSLSGLKSLGFDLAKMYQTDEFYVVGTDKKNLQASQFWVNKKHLYVTRVITNNTERAFIMDAKFNKYERLSGGWIAPEVEIFINGSLYMKEEYSEMHTPNELDQSIFNKEMIGKKTW